MLNSYFTRMQQAITENGGIIDKYIGDAIQAVFYDEPNKDNQVIRASKAALSMKKALIEFNKEREAKGLFTIENGIGIATDIAIIGTIGTSKGRKDFSVNGDVINRASELEAKTKGTTSKILISKKSLEFEDPFSQPFGCQLPQQQSFEGASLVVTPINNFPQVVGGSGFGVAKDERGLLISNDDSSTKTADYNYHSLPTTHHSEASSSANNPLTSNLLSLTSKENNCHENKTVYNTSLVYREFDKDSVELIDVRQ